MTDSELQNDDDTLETEGSSEATDEPTAQASESEATESESTPSETTESATTESEATDESPATDDDPESATSEPGSSEPASDAAPEMPNFENLEGAAAGENGTATLEILYDLSLPLTVELGRAALRVQDVLALGQGSVIRLDRVAGDPVDVYVGAKKLAQAEVVVLEEQFGIRITHIYPEAGTADAG